MQAYFFDLDGTLTDSRSGLYPAFRAGLAAIGVKAIADAGLARFLGSPLPEIFRTLKPLVTQNEIDRGIDAFRAHYEVTGVTSNELYPGVIEMLADIRQLGAKAWVVTSKPEFQATRVVAHLKLDVDGVIGAGLAENDTKTELVARALAAAQVPTHEALMLGDRHYDVIGALANHVLPVGAVWGYGSRDELKAAGCKDFVSTADEFRKRYVTRHRRPAHPREALKVATH